MHARDSSSTTMLTFRRFTPWMGCQRATRTAASLPPRIPSPKLCRTSRSGRSGSAVDVTARQIRRPPAQRAGGQRRRLDPGTPSARASRLGWNVPPRSATAIPQDRSVLRSNIHRSPGTPSAMRSSTWPRTTRIISARSCCCARWWARGRRHRAATLGSGRETS